MEGQYFGGFRFTQPQYEAVDFSVKLVPVERGSREIISTARVTVDELTDFPNFEITVPLNVRSLGEVLPEFKGTLRAIGRDLGCPLTMRKRRLSLVDAEELRPKTQEEARRLVDRYGEYMRDGGGGDCTLENGIYRLRVGIIDEEGTATKPIVLETAAHEYGHTLGRRFLRDATWEELKAYAFASLFQRHYDGETWYEESRTDLHSDRPHDIAIHRLGELLRSDVPEGAIISHLTGRRFGKFGPADYLNFA